MLLPCRACHWWTAKKPKTTSMRAAVAWVASSEMSRICRNGSCWASSSAEGGGPGSSHCARPWTLPLVTTGGALLSALLIAKFAPEVSGHGTDSAIEAIHTDPRNIRSRVVLVKLISSALTIGSGGSAGREGPTAQISAGFASLLTRLLNLTDADGRILVSLGVGAGIGAIFGKDCPGARCSSPPSAACWSACWAW